MWLVCVLVWPTLLKKGTSVGNTPMPDGLPVAWRHDCGACCRKNVWFMECSFTMLSWLTYMTQDRSVCVEFLKDVGCALAAARGCRGGCWRDWSGS